MRDHWHRVLPELRLLRNLWAEIAGDWPHVAMRQLEPRLRERVSKLIGIVMEVTRDLLVGRIESQREIRRQHRWRDLARRIVSMRHGASAGAVLRLPLLRAG